ncbi:helix-turn-helix domain-containing protein [Arcanobacterium pinnipediorum]|uniref:Helix-turn-helix domain-containing protein n=1 Tax=Arcanobacterium pinnipediorum TaxID=1503041 RepID=A0ABY5AEQ3_9ACTO|nr:helix-turn-helix transcriptional regulator [Arcanobacterium pinnipediorum]USR78684.1 helix-turn-helix domain-containing protein [Arcanobacterium pinnipediorum]
MIEHSYAERILGTILGKTLVARRKELGMTQEEVAHKAQINREHYQQMEYGRSDRKRNSPLNPKLGTLIRLANALRMPVEELLRDAIAAYEEAKKHEDLY